MSSLMSLLLSLGLGVFPVYAFYYIYAHPLSKYPGPLLAKLTNFWRLFVFCQGHQEDVDAALHKQFGPIVRDGPDSLLIADVEAFKAIYGFSSFVEKGDFYRSMSNHNPASPNVFAATTEALHKQARKQVYIPALGPKAVAQYDEGIRSNVSMFTSKISERLAGSTGKLNICPLVELFTFESILQAAYGEKIGLLAAGRDERGTLSAKANIWRIAGGVGVVPWLSRFLTSKTMVALTQRPNYDAEGRPQGLTVAILWAMNIFAKATKDLSDSRPSMLKNLLSIDSDDSRKMSIENVRAECINVLFAGTGSTAATLEALIYELGVHTGWQERIHTEARELGSPGPILKAVLKESLRLHPPFSSAFERVIAKGGENLLPNTKGLLPAGTRVYSNPAVMCRLREVFGQDAGEWNPDRWLKGSLDQQKRMDDVYCVFGRGSRGCIGKELATNVVDKAILAMIEKWRFSCSTGALRGRNLFEMQYDDLIVEFTRRKDELS